MGGALKDPFLRREQNDLHKRLYDVPSLMGSPPAGWDTIGECTIRMLLTALSHWRGAGAVLHPTGVWPRLLELPSGPCFLLGPILSAEHQLLTDAELIRLLCEGCPFNRPEARVASVYLNTVELDRHDSAARMRAILCASIFFEWREGEYRRRHQTATDAAALQAGFGCRLAHTRATMGRLIAGLNVHLSRQDLSHERGTDHPVAYAPGSIPLAGLLMPDSPAEPGPQDPPDAGRADGPPASPAAPGRPAPRGASAAPAAADGGGEGAYEDRRRSLRPRPSA